MFNIIERFMNRLTINQVRDFATSNNVVLSEDELNFTYEFIIKNWRGILTNPGSLDLSKYKNNYSPENFQRIEKLLNEYFSKYKNYL